MYNVSFGKIGFKENEKIKNFQELALANSKQATAGSDADGPKKKNRQKNEDTVVTGEGEAATEDAAGLQAEELPEEKDPVTLLEEDLKKAQENAATSRDRLLRATAEFDNYKKRSERELAEFRKFANESLIKELLPVMDNLERAIESSGDDSANAGIVEGVDMTLREIYKVLEKFNLKSLEAEGQPFDPNFHQAVIQEEADEMPDNTVMKVMQKGYILHDRLIRPAMVVVAKAPANNKKSKDSEGESADKVKQ